MKRILAIAVLLVLLATPVWAGNELTGIEGTNIVYYSVVKRGTNPGPIPTQSYTLADAKGYPLSVLQRQSYKLKLAGIPVSQEYLDIIRIKMFVLTGENITLLRAEVTVQRLVTLVNGRRAYATVWSRFSEKPFSNESVNGDMVKEFSDKQADALMDALIVDIMKAQAQEAMP